jgi:hypothetical protein
MLGGGMTTTTKAYPAKLGALLLLWPLALIIAGAYGALHDQISCTVSPEYFSRFKYLQFGLPPEMPLRLAAAIVGFLASWWMGIPIGAVLGVTGLLYPDARTMFRETLRAYGIVVATTLAVGLGGLLLGCLTVDRAMAMHPPFWIPEDVQDRVAFLRAGYMHNASYLGGALGLVIALIVQARRVVVLGRSA